MNSAPPPRIATRTIEKAKGQPRRASCGAAVTGVRTGVSTSPVGSGSLGSIARQVLVNRVPRSGRRSKPTPWTPERRSADQVRPNGHPRADDPEACARPGDEHRDVARDRPDVDGED